MKRPTRNTHLGRPAPGGTTVNPPIEQGSTVLYPDYHSFRQRTQAVHYGRAGLSTHKALEGCLCDLEGGDAAFLTGSGIGAIALSLLSLVKAGDHILVTDSAYDPTRTFCNGLLTRMGVETTYYDPLIGAGIKDLIRPETTAIFCESPGSLTFEVQDLPAIIAAAGDIPVAVDNTYAAGVFLQPLALGAAISLQALTKYVGGHSDLLMGAVMTAPKATRRVARTARELGISVSAQDVSLALRGLRTLDCRMAQHQESGLALARWLADRQEIARVLHPGLPGAPGHEIWARDGRGTCGLFGAILAWDDEAKTAAFIDALTLFGLGYSWGGFESLCMPAWPAHSRSAVPWAEPRQLLRFHIGLEAVDDLIADLERAFAKAAALG